ncbi:uncharacterized protein LOC129581470 [Paramacrobiotus metropolitanus]|uniref:uncharacterized protein LOC129581470 n=1 Tax=Paramacrobiotus metropolitanus TaxID=2943436 RepID=UPI0024459986|nr:uncharacterized protein LOC129581470 [Paramacrobiotus metropolitanus]
MSDEANKRPGTEGQPDGDEIDEQQPATKLDKASAQNAADMEKVTDLKEEKEFSGKISGNASAVLTNVASEQAKSSTGPVVITLRKVDIDALVEHFDVKRLFAERLLKKHHGDMRKAVRELMFGNAAQINPFVSSSHCCPDHSSNVIKSTDH